MNKEIQEKVQKYALTKMLIKYFQIQEFIRNSEKKINLSKLLKNEREKKDLTQKELAKIIGTHPLTLNEVETANLIINPKDFK